MTKWFEQRSHVRRHGIYVGMLAHKYTLVENDSFKLIVTAKLDRMETRSSATFRRAMLDKSTAVWETDATDEQLRALGPEHFMQFEER